MTLTYSSIDLISTFPYSKCMAGFIRRVIDFVRQPTNSRTIGILLFLILITAASLTVYVAQQQQQLRQRASGDVCKQLVDSPDSISNCADFGLSSENIVNSDCSTFNKDFTCKIDNTIFKCQEE